MSVAALLWLLTPALVAQAAPLPAGVARVASVLETTPSTWSGDSVDDPAIWVNSADPTQSLVIGNNKKGALEVYGLDGSLKQKITDPSGFWGNVDVRGDLVATAKSGVLLYRVQPGLSEPLVPARETSGNAPTGGEGLCMYDAGTPGLDGGLYVVNVHRTTFRVRMHPLTDGDNDGLLTVAKHAKQFYLGSEGEGCVVDDSTGYLYMSEEDVGIWRYDLKAPGSDAPPRVLVDGVGPHLAPDIEGLTLAGGSLIASAQNVENPQASWFNVYDASSFELVKSFRVVNGLVSDDCDQTDGITASTANLGPDFPEGLFVCQDGFNHDANGVRTNQSFKFVPLERVLAESAT